MYRLTIKTKDDTYTYGVLAADENIAIGFAYSIICGKGYAVEDIISVEVSKP